MANETLTRICSLTHCNRPRRQRNKLCASHYMRWYRANRGTTAIIPWLRKGSEQWGLTHPEFAAYFWSHIDKGAANECWEWQNVRNPQGYGSIKINGKTHRTHRIAWALTNGRMPELKVLHSCDNPPCCNPSHLREGTSVENQQDAMERQRWTPHLGEKHGNAKYTDAEIRQIKTWIQDGKTTAEIKRLDERVNKHLVSRLRHQKAWTHVTL